jgi:hypothetical protein
MYISRMKVKIILNSLKSNLAYKFSPYRDENTTLHINKDQVVNAV